MTTFSYTVTDSTKFSIYSGGKQVGYITMPLIGTALYFENADISLSNDKDDVTKDFIDFLFDYCKKNKLTVVSHVNKHPILEHIRKLLLQSEFSYAENTVNYVKANGNEESLFKTEYVLEHYLKRGKEYFISVLKQCSINDPYYEHTSIEDKFNEWITLKHTDTFWRLVFQDGEIIGVILPISNPNIPHLGNIDYIGVVPEARRKGHGVKLHNITLDIIFNDLKVKMYLGMTHKDNKPMIEVFKNNHCEFHDVIVFNTEGVTE